MRFAVFSDIHSNWEAFSRAAAFLKKQNIDEYVFLGDAVGYGASPNETVELLRSLSPLYVVAGNHDLAVVNRYPEEFFNTLAWETVLWTRSSLSPELVDFLNRPLVLRRPGFICSHGSLVSPEKFDYIEDIYKAELNFSVLKHKIFFYGHSHCKEIYVLKEGRVSFLPREEDVIDIRDDRGYLINVGSVGQPRDNDRRLCLCVYDDELERVEFFRLEYDIGRAARKIIKAGLPDIFAFRLYNGV